jgi:DNA-binding MarR family transcriptional regulator
MYRMAMAEITQPGEASAMPAVLGCAERAGQPGGMDAAQADVAGLIQLSGLVQGAFARIADRHGLTPVQARLLCVLAQGPRGMADLARCCGVEKAALTGLVDRAERRGLASRAPVPGDRRALRVTLTGAGRRSAAAFHADVIAELGQLLGPLTPRDREQFRKAMAKITGGTAGPAGF